MLLSDTVAEELVFAPYHQGLGRQDAAARAKEGLIALGLEGLADEAPLGLSRGQRLRVAAASVLTAHPRLLLLDEPTTGQDRQHIESLMETFVQHPALEAMLFCTHDVGAALRYANRLLVMQCGSIVADGPPGEVLRDPDVRARGGLRLPVAAQLGTRLGVTALSLEQWLDWLESGSSP